jgi:hypothetical protein
VQQHQEAAEKLAHELAEPGEQASPHLLHEGLARSRTAAAWLLCCISRLLNALHWQQNIHSTNNFSYHYQMFSAVSVIIFKHPQ